MASLLAPLTELYATAFGGQSYTYILEWAVLALVAVAPVICLPFVALNCCGKSDEAGKMAFGERTVLRKALIAVRADMRMGIAIKRKSYAAQKLAQADLERASRFSTKSGKELLQDAERAKNLAEEQFIRQQAEMKAGKAGKGNYRSY